MPNLTTALPRRTGDIEEDYNRLYNWAVSLTDELKNLLCNLDSGNVTEAASIKAQNIDASQAKIKDAQIASLTADKLTAGTIDAKDIKVINIDANNINTGTLNSDKVYVGNENSHGSVYLDGTTLEFVEKVRGNAYSRIFMGQNANGEYKFIVKNRTGTQGISMDENGDLSITGKLTTTGDGVIGGQIKLGEVANPMITFQKTSGSSGATIYYDDSNDTLTISANNIKLDGNIVS